MSGYLRVLFHKIARHLGQPEVKPLVYTLDVNDTLDEQRPRWTSHCPSIR